MVDSVGSLGDAIAAAAAIAGMEDYAVDYVELPLSPRDMLMKELANRTGSLDLWADSMAGSTLSGLLQPVRAAAQELSVLQDPRHLYMRCVDCSMVR